MTKRSPTHPDYRDYPPLGGLDDVPLFADLDAPLTCGCLDANALALLSGLAATEVSLVMDRMSEGEALPLCLAGLAQFAATFCGVFVAVAERIKGGELSEADWTALFRRLRAEHQRMAAGIAREMPR